MHPNVRNPDGCNGILVRLVGRGCSNAGVAYNELRSCSSIAYMYLCGAYPLAQVFSVLAIIAVVQTLIAFKTINLIKME